jgi:hypothetical protein
LFSQLLNERSEERVTARNISPTNIACRLLILSHSLHTSKIMAQYSEIKIPLQNKQIESDSVYKQKQEVINIGKNRPVYSDCMVHVVLKLII